METAILWFCIVSPIVILGALFYALRGDADGEKKALAQTSMLATAIAERLGAPPPAASREPYRDREWEIDASDLARGARMFVGLGGVTLVDGRGKRELQSEDPDEILKWAMG